MIFGIHARCHGRVLAVNTAPRYDEAGNPACPGVSQERPERAYGISLCVCIGLPDRNNIGGVFGWLHGMTLSPAVYEQIVPQGS